MMNTANTGCTTMATNAMHYTLTAPTTPGATPTTQYAGSSLREARASARDFARRSDLRAQDVILRVYKNGAFIRAERLGPCR